jgi:hypothetical protein
MKDCVAVEGLPKGWEGLTSIARIKEFCDAKAAGLRNGVRPDCIFFLKIEREEHVVHPTFLKSHKKRFLFR